MRGQHGVARKILMQKSHLKNLMIPTRSLKLCRLWKWYLTRKGILERFCNVVNFTDVQRRPRSNPFPYL